MFLQDMGRRPSPRHSIERCDVDGDYSPGNCRWVTREEQDRNRSDNVYLEYDGRKQIVSDWAREFGIDHYVLRSRLKAGWSMARAVSTPIRNRNR